MQCWSSDYTRAYDLLEASGNGGEGTVYQVKGQPALVAKIYSPQSLERRYPDTSGQYTWTMQEKVSYMASVAPSLPIMVDEGGNEVLAAAWPQEPLFDADNRFVGFLMPKVAAATTSSDAVPDLHFAYRARERQYLFGDNYTWLTAIKLARNLSTVVRVLHENGVVIGDFNCNNILIDRDAHVTLIDTDSFCVHNELRNITYRCVVGVGEFLAPELQGINLEERNSHRSFTQASDCFSLAIHIFMLLMNGTHPFSGRKGGLRRGSSSSTEPYVQAIASGACAYAIGLENILLQNETPRISALPDEIVTLFNRTFMYDETNAAAFDTIVRRPTAAEWEAALTRLHDACLQEGRAVKTYCPVDSTHVNYPHNQTCMWCDLEGRTTRLRRTSVVSRGDDAASTHQLSMPAHAESPNGKSTRRRTTTIALLAVAALVLTIVVTIVLIRPTDDGSFSIEPELPAIVTIPDVIGNDSETATETLKEAGLKVTIVRRGEANSGDETVVSQSPAGGGTVPVGYTVTLGVEDSDSADTADQIQQVDPATGQPVG